jgi:hypothetical protein
MAKSFSWKEYKPGIAAKGFLALALILPLVWVYLAGPNNRIYSFHGFVHVAISNQAAQGIIPPGHPFLAGEPLLYHWGYHWLGAWTGRILSVTPFWAFAVINLAALFFTALLLYRLSRLIVKNSWANILSVLVCLYGITPFPHITLEMKEALPFPLDERSIHPIIKYCNMNAVPLGLVFFLLFLYGLAGLFAGQGRAGKFGIALLLGVTGTAFFYPPFMIGVAACLAMLPCLFLACRILGREAPTPFLRNYLVAAGISCVGGLLLLPYLLSISAGIRASTEYLLCKEGAIKLAGCLVIYGPTLVILFAARRSLRKNGDGAVLFVLLSAALGNLIAYMALNQHLDTEYKYRILFALPLGIVAGIAFHALFQRRGRGWVYPVLALFLLPSFFVFGDRRGNHQALESMVIESGRSVTCGDEEEQQLYSWILEHTEPDSVFLDSKAYIPIFAGRPIFVLPPEVNPLGLDVNFDYFFKGDDRKLIAQRRRLLRALQSSACSLSEKDRFLMADFEDRLFYVTRRFLNPQAPDGRQWDKVFTSSRRNFSVYRFNKDGAGPGSD